MSSLVVARICRGSHFMRRRAQKGQLILNIGVCHVKFFASSKTWFWPGRFGPKECWASWFQDCLTGLEKLLIIVKNCLRLRNSETASRSFSPIFSKPDIKVRYKKHFFLAKIAKCTRLLRSETALRGVHGHLRGI